jgi:hypothetical protein
VKSRAHVSNQTLPQYRIFLFCLFAVVNLSLNLTTVRVILVPFLEIVLGIGKATVLYPKKHIASSNPCKFLVPSLRLLPLLHPGLYLSSPCLKVFSTRSRYTFKNPFQLQNSISHKINTYGPELTTRKLCSTRLATLFLHGSQNNQLVSCRKCTYMIIDVFTALKIQVAVF